MNYKIKTIDSFSDNDKALYAAIAGLTEPVNAAYPKYNKWLEQKFFPGIVDGSRKAVVVLNENNEPAGVALLKDTSEEKKICCLFVREGCRGRGIAGLLLEKSCEMLKTGKPLLTVNGEAFPQYQKLLDKHQFSFSFRKKGVYSAQNTEYYFNNEATEKLKKVLLPLFSYIKSKQK